MYDNEKKKIEQTLGSDICEMLKERKAWLAGGAITSLFTNSPINDFDIYFRSKEDLLLAVAELFGKYEVEIDGKWHEVDTSNHFELICNNFTDKSILFKKKDSDVKIQFIFFDYFESAYALFDSFDFTVCMGAYDFEFGEWWFDRDFFKHNAQRYLKYNTGTRYPLISALRVGKYKEKGYSISKTEYLRVVMNLMSLPLHSWEAAKEHIGGFYGADVDKYFDEEKPFSVSEVVKQLDKGKEIQPFQGKAICFHEVKEAISPTDYTGWKWIKMVRKVDDSTFVNYHYADQQATYKLGDVVDGGALGIWATPEKEATRFPGLWGGDTIITLEAADSFAKPTFNGREYRLLGNWRVVEAKPK